MKANCGNQLQTVVLITVGLLVGLIILWWQPLQPAAVIALLATTPFIVLAKACNGPGIQL